jgi:hypothetical protein
MLMIRLRVDGGIAKSTFVMFVKLYDTVQKCRQKREMSDRPLVSLYVYS